MGKSLQDYIKIYISKLKRSTTTTTTPTAAATATTTNRFLLACNYPKTESFVSGDRRRPKNRQQGATLSDVDRFLFENFNTLFTDSDENTTQVDSMADDSWSVAGDELPEDLRSTHRFFVSPGVSNSLVEEARQKSDEGVAVMTLSKNPYDDFKRSMQEMVDARNNQSGPLDWDFMEDLLFSYLDLNHRSVHKHVLRAFTDLTVHIRWRLSDEQT